MKKEIINYHDNLYQLNDEILSIIKRAHENATITMIEAKYLIGEAIVTNGIYKKHSKSQTKLFQSIEIETGVRVDTLGDCVKLYEKYPQKKADEIASELYTEHGAWRHIRAVLYGGEKEQRSEVNTCRHVWKCQVCGLIK